MTTSQNSLQRLPAISRLKLVGLGSIDIPPAAIVFVVGPNNGGKSTFLTEIPAAVGGATGLKWIELVKWELGTREEYKAFVDTLFTSTGDGHSIREKSSGNHVPTVHIHGFYDSQRTGHGHFLIRQLNAQNRIGLADQVGPPDVHNRTEAHPYHRFCFSTAAEEAFSKRIRAAFGRDFRINRMGSQIVGHLGVAPKGERLSVDYERALVAQMKPVSHFGDGVRSYAGILLNSSADPKAVTIIDEPEAFLHPPQARRLGRELALSVKDVGQQIFVATHSSDFIQGALSAKVPTIFLLLDHANAERPIYQVDKSVVEEFSRKPFLAHTNALDGLFYDQTVICEGEADIMFFKWALDGTSVGRGLEESFWISAYGKAAIPSIMIDMQKLGVRATCVFDLDVLLSPEILEKVSNAVGVDFSKYKKLIQTVAASIKVPPAAEALAKIENALSSLSEEDDEPSRIEAIRSIKKSAEALGKSWVLKSSGLAAIPKGKLYADIIAFIEVMREKGVIILEEGEIENYVPEIGGHGQSWVRAALESGPLADKSKVSLERQFKALT